MIGRVLFLLLALCGPAQAQSLTDLYLDSERTRISGLKEAVRRLLRREPQTDEDLYRARELQTEIRRVERRIQAIEDDEKRKRQERPE